jgi:hypothetical protein
VKQTCAVSVVSVAVIMSVTVTECDESGCNYECHCD